MPQPTSTTPWPRGNITSIADLRDRTGRAKAQSGSTLAVSVNPKPGCYWVSTMTTLPFLKPWVLSTFMAKFLTSNQRLGVEPLKL